MRWEVAAELDEREQRVAKLLQRAGHFYVFLREILPTLFDEAFQEELGRAYKAPRGTEPKPPALLATVTLLQAYGQVSDADAVLSAKLDKRWQLVLGNLGSEEAPFSQGILPDFRERMAAFDLDKRLLDRTVEIAKRTGKFGWQKLKAMLDASPLLGAGRVEDTWNLIGRALSTVVDCAAASLDLPRAKIVAEAKLELIEGSSIKAALDIDWDDPEEQRVALQKLLEEVEAVRAWVEAHAKNQARVPPLKQALDALERVLAQDLEPDPGGGQRIKRGVAKDRMPSLGDREMRHGRKSKSKLYNGYKRHIAAIEGTPIIAAAFVRPANEPEHVAMEPLLNDASKHGIVSEVLIDRGYLASPTVEALRKRGVPITCKPWPSRNDGRFTKEDFAIDLKELTVVCPARKSAHIAGLGTVVRFPVSACGPCPLRAKCTTAAPRRGRSLAIHQQEDLLIELRAMKKSPDGRASLRRRIRVEHALARMGHVQGTRARYKGVRKNTFDVRRCAAVANLQALDRAA